MGYIRTGFSRRFSSCISGCRISSDCPAVVALSLFDLLTLGTVGAILHLSTPPKVLERLSTTGRSSSMDIGKVAGSARLASAAHVPSLSVRLPLRCVDLRVSSVEMPTTAFPLV
jgi:hypothetical protein